MKRVGAMGVALALAALLGLVVWNVGPKSTRSEHCACCCMTRVTIDRFWLADSSEMLDTDASRWIARVHRVDHEHSWVTDSGHGTTWFGQPEFDDPGEYYPWPTRIFQQREAVGDELATRALVEYQRLLATRG